jgi:PAS domain S-box-containing protein
MAVWEYDIAAGQPLPSADLNKLLGFPETDVLTIEQLRSLYLPGEEEKVRQAALAAISNGERFFEVEYQARTAQGEARWYQMRAELVGMEAASRPAKVIGVLFDVSARKNIDLQNQRLLEEVHERERELLSALDAGSLAIFDYDTRTLEMKPSPRLAEMYGYPAGHVLTLADIRARYHPDISHAQIEEMVRELNDPAVREFELDLKLLLPDGKVRWLNGRGEYLRDGQGNPVRARGVVMDVTERKELELRQAVLLREFDHRTKNILAIVSGLASHTLRKSETLGEARKRLAERLQAVAAAHDVAVRAQWGNISLRALVEQVLKHCADRDVRWDGPEVSIPQRQSLSLALALHELCTNALKYGALSRDNGSVRIKWTVQDDSSFELAWLESGGPPLTEPAHEGFGSQLIKVILAETFHGSVAMDFDKSGLVCTLHGTIDRDASD